MVPMTIFAKIDMNEATRLTREGRLSEAMAVLRGEAVASPRPSATSDDERLEPTAPFLDMVPPSLKTGGAWSSPRPEPTARPKRTGSTAGTAGAGFEERTYSNEAGSRTYKLYVPSGSDGRPLPLVVMLHGCTQSPDDFAAGTRMNDLAEEQRFLVAYPAQPQSANMSKCWNWYNAGDQHRDRGEPSLIAGITRRIMSDFPVDAGRVYVAGLSAGGAAAAIMGSTYPDLYSAIGVHSGLACGAARDMTSAFTAMRQGAPAEGKLNPTAAVIPTIVFHGDRDATVSPVNGDQVIAQSKATAKLRITVSRGKAPGGICFTRTVQTDEQGHPVLEHWVLHGAGHAWSGGSTAGSYTEPRGPDATREMMRFFLDQPVVQR
jgi:poly(hydroxyalkanoate) depolymerase family esterase